MNTFLQITCLLLLLLTGVTYANPNKLWQHIVTFDSIANSEGKNSPVWHTRIHNPRDLLGKISEKPTHKNLENFDLIHLNTDALATIFNKASRLSRGPSGSPLVLEIPLLNHDFTAVLLRDNSVMSKGLQAKYPEIRSMSGRSDIAQVNVDYSPHTGFHGQLFTTDGKELYLEPASHSDPSLYRLYDVHANPGSDNDAEEFHCALHDHLDKTKKESDEVVRPRTRDDVTSQRSCTNGFQGDGFCDLSENNPECNYDGGDCCLEPIKTTFCSKDKPWLCRCIDPAEVVKDNKGCVTKWKGDGTCDPDNNTDDCDWDGGDCCKVEGQENAEKAGLCTNNPTLCTCLDPIGRICNLNAIGDGICQAVNNHELCKFDGGDCCYSKRITRDYIFDIPLLDLSECGPSAEVHQHPVTNETLTCDCIGEQDQNGCVAKYNHDNYCDPDQNREECDFDGGDCCGLFADYLFCDSSADELCGCVDPKGDKQDRFETFDIRTYRLAAATSKIYYSKFGGSIPAVLSQIVTVVNRANSIFRQSIAVQFELVPNTDELIQVIGQDYELPVPDTCGGAVQEAYKFINQTLGPDTYDVGHSFTTDTCGIATGKVCSEEKGAGTTGSKRSPDGFYNIILVHELGHQFQANHTWSTCRDDPGYSGLGTPGFQYELYSGSTLMSYGGNCAKEFNLPLQEGNINGFPREHYFHVSNLQDMASFVHDPQRGAKCGYVAPNATLVVPPPAPIDGTICKIPKSTPFALQGKVKFEAKDHPMYLYNWEQIDKDGVLGTDVQMEFGPLFRSQRPQASSTRSFPEFSSVLTGANTPAEILPTLPRKMKFALTVRDHFGQEFEEEFMGVGTFSVNKVVVQVTNNEPFAITSSSLSTTGNMLTATTSWGSTGIQTTSPKLRMFLSLHTSETPTEFDDMVLLSDSIQASDGEASVTIPIGNLTVPPRFQSYCNQTILFDAYIVMEGSETPGCSFFATKQVPSQELKFLCVDSTLEDPNQLRDKQPRKENTGVALAASVSAGLLVGLIVVVINNRKEFVRRSDQQDGDANNDDDKLPFEPLEIAKSTSLSSANPMFVL